MLTDMDTGKLKGLYENAHDDPIYCLRVISENLIATGNILCHMTLNKSPICYYYIDLTVVMSQIITHLMVVVEYKSLT